MFIANAPDLDFVPGLLLGKPNLFHHGISHSIGMGVIFSLFLSFFLNIHNTKNLKKEFLICFSLYCSHLLLDYISVDGRPPFGIPFLWPLTAKYFIFRYPILPPVWHSGLTHATTAQFFSEIFSIHNLYVIFLEFALSLPLLFMVWVRNLTRGRKTN
jgi:inner membrane protein